MKKFILLLGLCLLGGCFMGIETKSGYHFLSIPPSAGRGLAASCGSGSTFVTPWSKKEIYK